MYFAAVYYHKTRTDKDHVAAIQSSSSIAASAAQRNAEVETVLEVVRSTHDGDLLAPRDLKLAEHVVNFGRGALTKDACARWDEVVRQVRAGSYVKPWFHGVEHMTKDHQGNVFWRDVLIDHFSFRHADRERAAAQMLGACCRFLEACGRPVAPARHFEAFDEARHAHGSADFGRWLVCWATLPVGAKIDVVDISEATTLRESKEEVLAAVERLTNLWGVDRQQLRVFKVVTREDFDSAIEQMQQTCHSAQRVYGSGSYAYGMPLTMLESTLRGAIERAQLPLEDELMRAYFAGDLARVSQARPQCQRERG